jgi:hypothetical protein
MLSTWMRDPDIQRRRGLVVDYETQTCRNCSLYEMGPLSGRAPCDNGTLGSTLLPQR